MISVGRIGGGHVVPDGYTGVDRTDITLWWNAEAADFSGTNGTENYSAGDDTVSLVSGAVIGTDGGKSWLKCADANTYGELTTDLSNIITSAEGRIGFNYNAKTRAVNAIIGTFRYDATNNLYISLKSGDNIGITYYATGMTTVTVTATTGNVPANEIHFFEVAWKVADDYIEIFIDGESEGSSSASMEEFAGAAVTFRLGEYNSALDPTIWFTDVRCSDDSTKDLYATRNQLNYDNS